jgi:hypothetical protein
MAVALMFGFDWASTVFFNFSVLYETKRGTQKEAVLSLDLEKESVRLRGGGAVRTLPGKGLNPLLPGPRPP